MLSFKVIKNHPVLPADDFSIYKNVRITQVLRKYGKKKHFKASYCHTHILFFLFVFLLEKSLGFVFKEILITQST